MHWSWLATIAVAIGLIAYFGFGYLLMGGQAFRGAGLIVAFFIGVSIPLGHVVQSLLRRRTTADHPRCGQCGYNLTGHAERIESQNGICPECGSQLSGSKIIEPGHPDEKRMNSSNRKLAMTAAIVGTAGWLGTISIMIRQGGLQGHLWIIAAGVLGMWIPAALLYWKKLNAPR